MKRLTRAALMLLVVGVLLAAAPPTKDVIDTALAAPDLKVLVATAKEGSPAVVETLKGKGPFTVFAANDDAFKKIPAEKLQALLKDRKAWTEVLNYHVVAGEVKAADLAKAKTLKTLQGGELTVELAEGKPKLNGVAKVVEADVVCTNGVIHVVDALLLPPKK